MVRIFLDSGSLADIEKYATMVSGFTTNPSLLAKAGVTNYLDFAKAALRLVGEKPISFEVLSPEPHIALAQARTLSALGKNVFVKVPIISPQGWQQASLIEEMAEQGIRVNVTAITTREHVRVASHALGGYTGHILSIFAGRIADAGCSPFPTMNYAQSRIGFDTLWASARQIYDVKLAETCADIITLSPALIDKLPMLDRSLDDVALDTVRQFYNDARGIEL